MLVVHIALVLGVFVQFNWGQVQPMRRLRRFPPRLNLKTALGLKNRIKEKITQYRERTTQLVCYDIVGCFNLPHKNSPLQKVPEDPKMLDTKFYLFTRRMVDIAKPEVLYYDDNGKSLKGSTMDFSKPMKLIVHGYMNKWNEKGSIIMANAYLKLYDCNVILMDWHVGARGPQYPSAAANTELVGRQLGILLTQMVEKGLHARNIHLIGFSLGAHVCGTASESLKTKGYLIGRITGLDAASPLFRNNYFREKYKKLDRSDAKFVDVIHTDSSPFVTDGFGLWEPIGHVDFFANGGQDQPGCDDVKDSIVVSHFERGLTKEIVCSHVRAFHLFRESILNLLERQRNNKDSCEFTAYDCPGGMSSFEKGSCFPSIGRENDTVSLDPSYRFDVGKFGEEAKGEGVMFFSTRDSGPYCGTQLQASMQLSPRNGPMQGILQVQLNLANNPVTFQINCETSAQKLVTHMNGLAVAEYNSLTNNTDEIQARLNFLDISHEEGRKNNQTEISSTIYFDKLAVRDMYGNSWQYCGKDTKMEDKTGQVYGSVFYDQLTKLTHIMTETIKPMEFYLTVKQLGKGTFGTVQLCERIHNKQKIVVKQIVTELEGQQLEAAKNEVAILKSLHHPNIIQYYDSYIQKGVFYIVMEYASKGTLQEAIERERPKHFTPQHVMDLFCQILMGLDHIHRRKVIHRDLKSENLFLTGLKADVIKIGDFGISKSVLNGKMANTVIGTCNYLAPELCDGKPYNSKSDIWSLGCILFEMCAMEKMFDGTVSNIVLSIASGRKKSVNAKKYGKQMQEMIDMMLQPNPEDRPDTVALMAHPDIFPSLYYLGSFLGCIE